MALNPGELEGMGFLQGLTSRCKKGGRPHDDPAELLLAAISNPSQCFVCMNMGMVSTGAQQCGKPEAPKIKCPKCFPKEYGL